MNSAGASCAILGEPKIETRRLDEIIALDPLGAIALSKAAGETRILEAIMKRWAMKDPIAAFRASDELPEFVDFFDLRGDLANAALRDATGRGDTALLLEVLATAVTFRGNGIGFRPTEPSPELRREMLGALADPGSHHPHFIGMFARFVADDFAAAEAWLEARPELAVGRSELVRSLINAQFEHDFDAALEQMTALVEQYPPGMREGERLVAKVAKAAPLKAIPLLA